MTTDTPDPSRRRPCLALMGEFSAGKSTLANLLLDRSVSPVRVTATQLPPVRYRSGVPGCVRVAEDGGETALAFEDLGSCDPARTRRIEVTLDAPILRSCDLVDMPGSSDPSMPADAWKDMLDAVDGVIWCTPATQAWRQSEAALWQSVGPAVGGRGLLVVTRMDCLSERDTARVLGRLRREAGDWFDAILPVSLTRAIAAEDTPDGLRNAGVEALADRLRDMVADLAGTAPTACRARTRPAVEAPQPGPQTRAPASAEGAAPVRPRRVRLAASARRPRPVCGETGN